MAAAGKAAAVAAAKPTAGLGVVLAVQVAAGRAGVPAAPARDVGAVAAVPRTEAATVAGQLGALGLVQQTGVDFTQKGRRRVAARLAEDHPRAGGGQVQLLLGAGDSHVAEAAFLLHVLLIILGHLAGEDTILHTYDKNIREFQTLRRVDRHHRDAVGVVVIAVQIGNQRDLLQKARQRRVLAVLIGVGLDAADQLAQVLAAGLALLLHGFEHCLVAGLGDDVTHKLVQRLTYRQIAQLAVHLIEALERRGGALQFRIVPHMGDDFHHRHALGGCQLTDLFNRRHTDFTRRLVDNAAQAHVVPRVYDDGQIAVDVLDLLAVKEALAAHNAVRDARAGKVGLDWIGLSVHAVEHGVVLQARAFSQMLTDDVRNVASLVLLVRRGVVVDLLAVAVVGPEGLALAAHVVLDDTVGGVQNISGGAIVLFQTDRFCPGENLLKVEDIFNRSTAEFVDRLVIVANDADVVGATRQQPHQMELRNARVLVLVHDDIAEAVLVVFPRFRVILQQFDSVENQVVKVHGARGL